ncbi:HAD family hydrolase [Hylemonella gracilis]|uniref:HaD-superfamily hydrolase, subfamily ia, variant 3 n=1 Tax=Hylemonella gracilis ATCC 19624 TaxID=887062 RepID=F3KUK6_9BURK|nr:HAD family phosphatase [Hylemonella gracilis]EGI76583.1 haD-superfamily hydrolase, subfamily ia, variant 3 [Hylemonella gracilis ATCC 19624]
MNIVFDFGAVLFTWQPTELVRRHFPQLTPTAQAAEDLARAVFHHEDWQGFDRGAHALDEAVARIAARLRLPGDALHELLAPIGEQLAPIDDTVTLLARLRERREADDDLRLYFLSNMPAPFARALERRHDFIGWFDGGIFSGDVQLAKPQPEIYRLLESRHGLEPARTVFIDDMQVNVEAARALGWQAIHCTQPERLGAQLQALLPQRV